MPSFLITVIENKVNKIEQEVFTEASEAAKFYSICKSMYPDAEISVYSIAPIKVLETEKV